MTQVLLVDDDPIVRAMFGATLERLGYQVHTDDGGTGLCARVRALRPDVVLLDALLGETTAAEVLPWLAQAPAPPPVVIVSGYLALEGEPPPPATAAFVALMRELGAVGFLPKGASEAEIAATIAQATESEVPHG